MRKALVLPVVLGIALGACQRVPPPEAKLELAGTDPRPVGAPIVLDGHASVDPQGATLAFAWRVDARPAGSTAAIPQPTLPVASFRPDVEGEYRITLAVSNGRLTATASTTFTAACGVSAPQLALVEPPAEGRVGSPVSLAITVTDADADAPCSQPQAVEVAWRFAGMPAGSRVTIAGASGTHPSFVPDRAGEYTLEAAATDSTGRTTRLLVPVAVGQCGAQPPAITEVGATPATVGAAVLLSATVADADAAPPCNYPAEYQWKWSFTAKPAGSEAKLEHASSETPSFVPDQPGRYAVALTVTDATGRTARRELDVEIGGCGSNAPVVDATSATPASPNTGQPVSLAATITDADNEAEGCLEQQTFDHEWRLVSQPAGSRAALSDPRAARPWLQPDVPGEYALAVRAVDSTGRAGAERVFTIEASTCGSARPSARIVAATDGTIGASIQVSAEVTDADTAAPCGEGETVAYAWSLAAIPGGSRATLNAAHVSNPTFVPDVAGRYTLKLVALDAAGHASEPVFANVEVAACGGHAPVAAATFSPESAGVGQPVRLEASATDADNESACGASQTFTYAWEFVSLPAGSAVALDRAHAPSAAFTGDVSGDYVLRLRATDSTGRVSEPSLVRVPVSTCGAAAPVASIAASKTAPGVGEPIVVSASATDADTEAPCSATQAFTWQWSLESLPAGSTAKLNDASAKSPGFTPDRAGDYVVALRATDSTGRTSAAARATISATSCGAAAPSVTITASTTTPGVERPVLLTATAADVDNEAPCSAGQRFTFAWELESLPSGSTAKLSDPAAVSPWLAADRAGSYVVAVRAIDSTGRASAAQRVTITASSCGAAAPTATITASASSLPTGAPVQLTAGVADSDNDAPCSATQSFTLAWALDALPAGSRAVLRNAAAQSPSFTPDLPGDYVVRLVATDSTGRASAVARRTIVATACGAATPAVTASSSTDSPAIGELVTFAAAATDADDAAPCSAGQRTSYRWSISRLPAGSRATLFAADTAAPWLTPDVAGEYELDVVAIDSTGRASAPGTVGLSASPCGASAPMAVIAATPETSAIGVATRLAATVTDADNQSGCQSRTNPNPLQTFSYEWALLSAPSGSRARLSTTTASTPSLVPDRAGQYSVRLVVTDSTGLRSSPRDETITANACGGNAPGSLALSLDKTAPNTGDLVALGATFVDVDNSADCQALLGKLQTHSYAWRVAAAPAGSRASLERADRVDATFRPDVAGAYQLELTVTDSTGRWTRGLVAFTAATCGANAPSASPAVAGASELRIGGNVHLLANASDADNALSCGLGQELSYEWRMLEAPAGSNAMFENPSARDASFTPDVDGNYVAGVVVTDSTGRASALAAVSIATSACGGNAPVARARVTRPTVVGPSASVMVDPLLSCRVQLDARDTTDADAACGLPQTPDDLHYRWRQILAPAGSTSRLREEDRANPWFDIDEGGTYEFRLFASDGRLTSESPAVVRLVHKGFTIDRVAPAVACVGGVPTSFTLTAGGQGFLRINATNTLPTVRFIGMQRPVQSMSGCGPSGVAGVDACTTLTFNIDSIFAWFLPQGDYPIEVTNPVQDGCSARTTFSVGPAPTISTVSPTQVCAADDPLAADQFVLNIRGSGYRVATQASLEGSAARSTTVRNSGEMDALFDIPAPGVYDLTLSNGAACSVTKTNAVAVLPVPLVFFTDPPVLYNAISTQVTIYISGLNGGTVNAVRIRPRDSGVPYTSVPFTYNPLRPNQVQATMPSGLAPGEYDVIITDGATCTSMPVNGFRVTNALTLALDAIDPPFGWTNEDTPVDLRIADPVPGGKVAFSGLPRVYLNQSSGAGGAQALRSVAVVNSKLANAVVPTGLPVGTYDVIVVNPDGAVGLLPAAYRVTAAPPPTVDVITPGSIPSGAARTVVVGGANFNNPTVAIDCRFTGGARATFPVPVVSGDSETLTTSVPGGSLSDGTVCVFKVTNPDGSYGEYSALGVTSPSENLQSFKAASSMTTARRALAATSGRPTRTARFLYAFGGDGGTTASALSTMEAAPVDRFGDLGTWRALPTALPGPRTFASAQTLGRFVYLVGGTAGGGGVQRTVYRAEILDPARAPDISDLFLELNANGLTAGTWVYRVAAVMSSGHLENPSGESLPSDPLAVNVPAGLPQKLRATLTWTAVPGAAKYRIYRTPTANLGAGQEQFLNEVTATSYVDDGTRATTSEAPRRIGDLGEWRRLADMGVARMGMGSALGLDPANGDVWYLYAIAGSNGSTTHASYEYLRIDNTGGTQTPAASWTTVSNNLLRQGRWQAGSFVVNDMVTTRTPGEWWIHLGPGANADGTMLISDHDAARITTGGTLSPWSVVKATNNRAGYAAAAAANQLFIFGGDSGAPSINAVSAQLCGVGEKCAAPNVANWNAGISLSVPRYLPATTVESARIFVLGGVTTGSVATRTVESVIW